MTDPPNDASAPDAPESDTPRPDAANEPTAATEDAVSGQSDDGTRHSHLASAAFVVSLLALVAGIAMVVAEGNFPDSVYMPVAATYAGLMALGAALFVFAALGLLLSLRLKGWDPALSALAVLLIALWIFRIPVISFEQAGPPSDPKEACEANLKAIAQGLGAYADRHGHWPYDARGPLFSLALLYPKFVADPAVFISPGKGDKETRRFDIGCALAGKRCSFGYDHDFAAIRIKPETPVAGDLPGNHADGAHVITFDKQVRFTNEFVLGEDPKDNIYTADEGLAAEVDTHIRQ